MRNNFWDISDRPDCRQPQRACRANCAAESPDNQKKQGKEKKPDENLVSCAFPV